MKVDMVVMRHPSPGASVFYLNNVNSCIINAGDGCHEHPTQALLDAFTIKERLGALDNKKILITGDILHSRLLFNILFIKNWEPKSKYMDLKSLIPKYINELGNIMNLILIKVFYGVMLLACLGFKMRE